MYGDFSRVTFAPERHYLAVLVQQGRVQLDADANENTAILLHHLRTLAADLIGPGVPRPTTPASVSSWSSTSRAVSTTGPSRRAGSTSAGSWSRTSRPPATTVSRTPGSTRKTRATACPRRRSWSTSRSTNAM